jgi:hypothetical protein
MYIRAIHGYRTAGRIPHADQPSLGAKHNQIEANAFAKVAVADIARTIIDAIGRRGKAPSRRLATHRGIGSTISDCGLTRILRPTVSK